MHKTIHFTFIYSLSIFFHHYKTISISNSEFLIKHIIVISDKNRKGNKKKTKKLINIGIDSNSSEGDMKEKSR